MTSDFLRKFEHIEADTKWRIFCRWVDIFKCHNKPLSEPMMALFAYTSGQRYGINSTKWHLREFDRYLLFLVICSISERNAVDFIDPLRNQFEWPKTVSIVDRWDSRERKKVSSGVVTWSEVCLAIIILMRLCSVGFRIRLLIFFCTFKGDHATKFARAYTFFVCFITKSFLTYSFFPPIPALSTISRPLSSSMCSITPANCQVGGKWQFSARSSQDAGVSRMHKQNFETQPRDWPTTSEEAWRFNENLHTTGRPSTAPNVQNEPLHLGSSSANADDPPVWEVDVLGSLWSTGDAAVSGGHASLLRKAVDIILPSCVTCNFMVNLIIYTI